MLQAFTIPSPATPKEHPRLPLVRYPSTQRCSSDRDSSRRTIRWTSGAQADGRAVHKQADERRISDASAMHQRCTRDRATARGTRDARVTEEQRDARCTSRWTSDGPAERPAMDQRCRSDESSRRTHDARGTEEQRDARCTSDGPAMDQRCTSDRATPRPTMDEQATDHDSSRPVRDEQWTTGRRDCSTTTASRGLSRLLPTATAMLAVHALQARFTRRRRRCTPTNCTEMEDL